MTSDRIDARTSGILLHPTCLPGPFGIGDLGPMADAWINLLAQAGQTWWQMLPVGPTGYGDSPYQSPSTFAGNLNLISPERLAEERLIGHLAACECELPNGGVLYSEVVPRKRALVRRAWDHFQAGEARHLRAEFESFRAESAWWLEEFALFAAIKDSFGGEAWWNWPQRLAFHDAAELKAVAAKLAEEIEIHQFGQFLFFQQWNRLREHAKEAGIGLIGDLPIYVAHDSADVWAHPEFFVLDEHREPIVVGGVPPDYFSSTGQLWGNPIYNWEAHQRTGYSWWVQRLKAFLRLFDLVRLDHFRGIEAYWAVPGADTTSEHGKWLPGPRADLLETLQTALGGLPIIAEDLGFITPEVDALRQEFGLPGMRILQFAFGGAVEPRFLPHRFDSNLLVYTGTHDNDTTKGWYEKLTAAERNNYHRYVPDAKAQPVRALIRLAWSSVAKIAVVPLQDLLGLGSEARMNTPGTATGNWRWRLESDLAADSDWTAWLADLGEIYERNRK
jgi:4-alpha-glucanotransferase